MTESTLRRGEGGGVNAFYGPRVAAAAARTAVVEWFQLFGDGLPEPWNALEKDKVMVRGQLRRDRFLEGVADCCAGPCDPSLLYAKFFEDWNEDATKNRSWNNLSDDEKRAYVLFASVAKAAMESMSKEMSP